MLRHGEDYARKKGAGRSRVVAQLDAAAARIGAARVSPMPEGVTAVAYRSWVALAPTDPTFRSPEVAPDPAFEDAVGASLAVTVMLANRGVPTIATAPGPLMVSPHALGRLHDRGGARTPGEAHAALDALYGLLLRAPEVMALRWGALRILAGMAGERGGFLLPGPRGGAWGCSPSLMTIRGHAGRRLFVNVRSYLPADMLRDEQTAEVAGVEAEIAAAQGVVLGAHHVWFPGFPAPYDPVAQEVVTSTIEAVPPTLH